MGWLMVFLVSDNTSYFCSTFACRFRKGLPHSGKTGLWWSDLDVSENFVYYEVTDEIINSEGMSVVFD